MLTVTPSSRFKLSRETRAKAVAAEAAFLHSFPFCLTSYSLVLLYLKCLRPDMFENISELNLLNIWSIALTLPLWAALIQKSKCSKILKILKSTEMIAWKVLCSMFTSDAEIKVIIKNKDCLTKSNSGADRISFSLQVTVHYWRKSGESSRNLK